MSSIHSIDASKLRDSLFMAFEHYFDSNDLEYTGLDSLLTDEEIAEVIGQSKTTTQCEYDWDGDIEKVKETIKNNSIKFLKEHSEFESAFYEVGENNYDLFNRQIEFENAFDEVMNDFVVHSSNNISEDICKFQTLHIVYGEVEGNSSIMGYYDDDTNTIVLCYQSMMEACKYLQEPISVFLTHILSHELNHVRQIICEDRQQEGQQYKDVCYIDDVSFIIESSAESALYNVSDCLLNKDNFTYSFEREFESLFFLFAVCNEEAEIRDYYNAIFDANLEELYEFLGCDSEEDIYSFYNFLGSIDGTLGRNRNLDSGIETIGDAEEFIKYNYKLNLFHYILSDMVDYTCSHSDFTLEDNLTLFKIVRAVLCDGSYMINDEIQRVYDLDFVSLFKEAEDIYYVFLSMYYQTDIVDMKEIEESYANGMVDKISYLFNTEQNSLYYSDVTSFLKQFPLLKPVFIASDVDSYTYERFVIENEAVYKKKK